MRRGTLVIKGWYGMKNFGDDLLLAALTNALRGSVNPRIVLWCRKRGYLRRIAPEVRILEPWTHLQQPVALLWGGGTQFFTFADSAKQWYNVDNLLSVLRGRKRLARAPVTATHLLLRRLEAVRLQRVVWRGAIGVGVGPFREVNKQMEEQLRTLRSMDWVAVRDEESLQMCIRYGVQKVTLGADLAFLHPLVGERAICRGKVTIIPRVSPMDKDWAIWEGALLKALRSLGGDSLQVVALCERDYATAGSLSTRLGASFICWNPEVISIEEMIECLASARLVVSARYHGALIAAAAGVPTLVLGLEQKLESLGRQLNNVVVCHSPAELLQTLRHLITGKSAPSDRPMMTETVNQLKERAVYSFNELLRQLELSGIEVARGNG